MILLLRLLGGRLFLLRGASTIKGSSELMVCLGLDELMLEMLCRARHQVDECSR